MNLVLDLGNTTSHVYVFDDSKCVARRKFSELTVEVLDKMLKDYSIKASILSSVVNDDKEIEALLAGRTQFIRLNHSTEVPIQNMYETPETLGTDRLACAVGGAALHPGRNVLIIDAGTCIKYDFVTEERQYLGGSITPGFQMRLDALHQYTDRLPQLKADTGWKGIGTDTRTSMLTGVFMGIIYEMNGFISQYSDQCDALIVLLTGGDASHFAYELNFPIFANPDLTGIGLNEILRHHASRH